MPRARIRSPQRTALFTSAPMLAPWAAVKPFSANAVGHIPDERAVEVIEEFAIGFTRYEVGRRFDRDHVLVKAHPEFFGTPRRPLVKK